MRSPLSSQSNSFLDFAPLYALRTPTGESGYFRTLPLVARVMPPKRTVTLGQDSPSFSDLLVSVLRKRLTATLPDWRLREPRPRSHWPRPCVRCLRQTSIRVGSRLCPMRTAGRSTTICIRPLAIRRSLVPGRPFCHAAASRQARLRNDRPDQSSTRRYRRFTCFALPALLLLCAKLVCLGKRSRLCRRATDKEYPGRRRTKGARRRG
jgi:hypothetical protein